MFGMLWNVAVSSPDVCAVCWSNFVDYSPVWKLMVLVSSGQIGCDSGFKLSNSRLE